MVGDSGEKRPSLIATTVKAVVAVAAMSWLAAHWLSSATDRPALALLAAKVSRGGDPETTGSIGARASAARLDPCSSPRR